MRYSPPALGRIASCLAQPTPIPNPQHPLRVDATPPILLASSLNDLATGYPWTLSTAKQIGAEARVLTYEGSGHSVIDRYLISQSVPANGVRCPEARPSIMPRRAAADGAFERLP
ncbi:alpha/beta hydrolase [Nonomuraea sp. NPDC049141]|uniref:alpha/beta hydrolase n=1 Tax=Nonomuraea sp. NPDC049141 TaxID=3155500 RepID=UPI0033E29EAD